eukprot:TCONS_00067613-protein
MCTGNSNVLIKKKCDYIGSIDVPFFQGAHQKDFINDKLMSVENVKHGLHVKIVITTIGVKIYRKKVAKLGHGIAHILFSSCLPSKHLFAYVTKSYSVENIVVCQAHAFKLYRSNDLHLLNEKIQCAFNASTFLLRNISFEEYDSFGFNQRLSSKRWSKSEHHLGHDKLDYVMKIKDKIKNPTKEVQPKPDESNDEKDETQGYLHEYDIIEFEDVYSVTNEFYCSESMIKYEGALHFETVDEYYTTEVLEEQSKHKLEEYTWLLSHDTSPATAKKNLANASIGSYFVVPSVTRENSYSFFLKVPIHINAEGLMDCTVKEAEKGFHIQGCAFYFECLVDLVHHYGSIHNTKLHGKDHTDSSSSISSLASPLSPTLMENDEELMGDFVEDYEVYESVQQLVDELCFLKM